VDLRRVLSQNNDICTPGRDTALLCQHMIAPLLFAVALTGDWIGTSSCTNRTLLPACRDENVDYHLTERRAGVVHILMDRVVDDKPDKNVSLPWTIASGSVDVDGDGVPDEIRVETPDGMRHVPLLPCAGCDDAVEGHFFAVVRLSKSGRTVRTPVIDHFPNKPLWSFPTNTGNSHLAIADYNGDGRPDFNLGQFTNSNKWEYVLFTIHADGRVEKYALDKPEIYVSPGGEPSTAKIEAIPGGIRFRDFGNAGEHPGWATMTCLWHADRGEFRCSMR
jgi:hypothetical protein